MGKLKKFIKISKLMKILLPVILILVLITIIVAPYIIVLDTGTYKENDWSNTPYASSEYIAGTKIGSNGALETTETAQEIWDKLIKNGSNIEQYLDGPEELKKLMNAEIATQLLNTSNSDEEIDWDKINSDASSKEVQGLVKLLRAGSDGVTSRLNYVTPDVMDYYIARGETQNALNSFTIGEKKKKKYSGSTKANFSVQSFIDALEDICNEIASNYNDWCYGNSTTTPPCDYEVVTAGNACEVSNEFIGQRKRIIACDRIISLALWNMGLTDQPAGGINGPVIMQEYLLSHGFMQITDQNDLQAGDIVIIGGVKSNGEYEEVHHWYVLADFDPSTQTGSRYDMGNNGRIRNPDPEPRNAEPLLYDGQTFYCAYRVNGSGFVGKSSDASLGDRYDITETTTDIHGKNLLDRISDTENGSLHGKTLEELSRDGINLSYLVIPYYGIDGRYHSDGEMIVNTKVADEVLLIFQELYNEKYPIESLRLVDDFDASDEQSVKNNNTSAFNYRHASDAPDVLSNHARGFAIDINPLVNPYINNYWGGGTKTTDYNTDTKFMDRVNMSGWTTIQKAQKIDRNAKIYKIFTDYGWEWLEHAGANGNSLDSQHFSKPENSEFKKIDWNNSEKNSSEQDEPEFIKYNLTDEQLIQLASLCQQEQGSPKGAAAEASLMANILELHKYETTEGYSIDAYGLYNWVRNGGWFSEAALYMDEKKATNEVIEAVRSVLVDGKRVLPRYVNEHDCFGDIISVTNNGEAVDINDKSNYIKNVSIITNKHNSTYTFYDFPGTNDPFGTTLSIEDIQELGDECYDFDTGEITGESNKSSQSSKNSTGNKNTTFYAKVATWSEVTNICETTYEKSSDKAEVEQDEIVNTNENNLRLTLTNVNYQDFISGYTMPFNYLWALLITSQNKDLVMDLADLVYNSKIEITIYDNLNVNTSVKVEQYTKKRDIETGILARTQFTDSQGQTHNITYPLKNYNDSDEVKYTKTYTTITKTNTITQSLSKADVWIVNYTQNYNYMPKETTVTEGDIITKENQTLLPPETKLNQDIYRHLPGYENEIKQSTRESEEYQQAMAQARSDAAGTTEHDNENSEDNTQEIESINVSDFAITTIVDRLYNRITRSLINQQEQTTITNEVTKYVSVPAKMEKKDKKGGTIIAQNKTLDGIVRVLEDKRITKIKKEDIEKAFDEETNSKLKPLKFCQDGKILKIRCTGKGENKKYTLYKLENFVQILLDNHSAKKILINDSAYKWLIKILEINADTDAVEMIDITKYLIYKATGKNLGIDENNIDFSVYDPANFKKTSTGTIGGGFVGSNLEEKLWWLLKDIGYSDIAAAGAMGNFSAETDDGREIHSDRIQSNGEGIGIVQWSFGRKQGLLNYAASQGSTWQDENIQLEFLKAELTDGGCNGFAQKQESTENSIMYNRFINAETPEDAAVYFDGWFERSGGQILDVRERGARFYYEMFEGKERPLSLDGNSSIIEQADKIHKYMEQNNYKYCVLGNNSYEECGQGETHGLNTTFEESKTGYHHTCCATYVSWVLQEAGLISNSEHTDSANELRALLQSKGWKKITNENDLKSGDILGYDHHVEIYAGENLIYNAGSGTSIRGSSPRERTRAFVEAWRAQ